MKTKNQCFYLSYLLLMLLTSCLQQSDVVDRDSISVIETTNKEVKESYTGKDIVTSSIIDDEGNLWFGTTRDGIYMYDGEAFTNFTVEDGLNANEVWSLLYDSKGIIWIGTADGLCKYDGKRFEKTQLPWDGKNDLWGATCNPGMALSLIEDASGNLWIGTCGGGALKYDGKSFTTYLEQKGRIQSDGLYHNLIKSMVMDQQDQLWFTSLTQGGISRLANDSISHFGIEQGMIDSMVFCSTASKKGDLWFGCIQTEDGGGLYCFRDGRFEKYNQADGLCDNFIFSLYSDHEDLLWIGTGQEICTYDGNEFSTPFDKHKGLIREVRTFIEDNNGNLWFGGRKGSLWKFDGSQLHDFTYRKGN